MGYFELCEAARIDRSLEAFPLTQGKSTGLELLVPPIAMPMHMGIDGGAYVLTFGGDEDACFLKAFADDMASQFSISGAIKSATVAGELGIGPKVLAADDGDGVVLFDLLVGFNLVQVSDFDRIDIRRNAIAALRSWHGQNVTASEKTPLQLASDYRIALRQPQDKGDAVPVSEYYNATEAWIERILDALSRLDISAVSLHGENALSNFMFDADGSVKMVDFERGLHGDPMFDIGGLFAEYCREEADFENILLLYDPGGSEAQLARAKLYMIIDDYIWGSWGKLAHYHSERRNSIEFYKYGEIRLLRCFHYLTYWDVEALIRKL